MDSRWHIQTLFPRIRQPEHDVHEKKLLRPKMVEQIYDIPQGYQAKMRCAGIGPEYIKLGSKIYYEQASIQRWLDTKRRINTSDPDPAKRQVAAR